jgi:hypothetical protein
MAFPGSYNFNYYRGDTAEFVIRPKTANGSAFDLTGYTAEFFIATARGSSGTQYEAQAVVSGVADTVTCTILPGVGRDLTPGTYVYDVQITTGVSVIFTILTGSITVTDDITGAV